MRERLGLTQERLASWLGTTRAILAQMEIGRGGLPLESGMAYARLALAMQGVVPDPEGAGPPQPAPAPLPTPPAASEPLAQRLHYCRHHAQRLRRELAELQLKAQRYELRLKALPALRAWTGPVANPAREENWLALLESETVQALRDDCGAGPQRLLEARLAGLEREAELLAQTLAGLPEAPLAP